MSYETENYWRTSDTAGWIATYRASAQAETRIPLLDAYRSVAPYKSVLDLGCNVGPTVGHLLTASPEAEVLGIDLNALAIRTAKADWPAHRWLAGSIIDWLPVWAKTGWQFDLVTSNSCLCCLDPADIEVCLSSISTLTSKLVLQEVSATPMFGEGRVLGYLYEYRYDWPKRLAPYGWRLTDRVWQQMTTTRPSAVMTFVR